MRARVSDLSGFLLLNDDCYFGTPGLGGMAGGVRLQRNSIAASQRHRPQAGVRRCVIRPVRHAQ